MDLALAQVAAGLPMAASLALVSGVATLREGRRRAALNEAMHELRRPLQVLSLSLPADPDEAATLGSSLRMATAALERLDCEINGETVAGARRPIEIESMLGAAVVRWRGPAARAGRGLTLRHGGAPGALIYGEEVQLSQVVDNVISNAIDHGRGQVTVEAREDAGRVFIRVVDAGPKDTNVRAGPSSRVRLSGRYRRGHGLRVVWRVARAHGGSFCLRGSAAGTEACLELPLHRSGSEQ
jgi:signal transduction histidine kinase